MNISELRKLITGNGDIKEGLLYKVDQNEKAIMDIKEGLDKHSKLLRQNNDLLVTISKNGKSDKTIFGMSPQLRDKVWLIFIRTVMTAIGAKYGIDFISTISQ